MKLPPLRHRWNLSPRRAIRLQERLAAEVRQQPLPRDVRYVAGGDASFTPDGCVIAAWIVWDLETREAVDQSVVRRPVTFPYVPGLLSFREAPALIAAARRLKTEPEVFMLDGQGLAHPRRFGLASHVGLLLDRPSVGCAKSLLCGRPARDSLGESRGARCALVDDDEVIGAVLRTRRGTRPVYVSVGHLMTLDDAISLTLRCCGNYRLPEPARLAHQLVTRLRAGPGGGPLPRPATGSR